MTCLFFYLDSYNTFYGAVISLDYVTSIDVIIVELEGVRKEAVVA
jgi:hypothetical protein